MKATELRIGNYFLVNWSNEIRCADWMDIRDIDENIITGGVSPIPLTPEVLEKCPQVTKRDGYPYKILNGHIVKRADGKYIFKYYDIYVVLDYIHQLQNLYFALTGEELQYKP